MKLFKELIKMFLIFVGVGTVAALLVIMIVDKNPNITTQSKIVFITGSTFDMDVIVLVTEDTAYAAQYVRENLDSTVTSKDFNARAVTFGPLDGKPIIVWLSDAEDKGIVAHEFFHATLYKMYWAGMELHSETEEAFAYELQYLTNQFYNQVNKIQ
jgi:hypothetical protein